MLSSRSLLSIALTVLPIVGSLMQPTIAQSAPLVVTQDHKLTTARYLGGVGNNEARATAFAPNGDILVGGNFANLQTTADSSRVLSGASASAPGTLLRLSNDGTRILKQITLGQRIDSLQVRDRIVVGGDFGVAVLDNKLNPIWQNSLPGLDPGNGGADGGQTRVTIESSGRVAVLRAKTVTFFSKDGQKLASRSIAVTLMISRSILLAKKFMLSVLPIVKAELKILPSKYPFFRLSIRKIVSRKYGIHGTTIPSH